MTRGVVRLLVACAACAACGGGTQAGRELPEADASPAPVGASSIVFGLSAYYAGVGAEAVEPLAEHLSKALGIPVRIRVAEPYRDLPELVLRREVDIAQLAPHPYVRLRALDPAIRPLVTPVVGGSPTYLGHFYVREDAPFRTLADLKGARVGWVSAESSSGYLFARDLLRRRGLGPEGYFSRERFYWSHPAVLQAVLRKDVDVGAAFDVTSDWSSDDTDRRPAGLRVIAKTERVPNDCVVARSGLDEGTASAVERALLDLRPDRPGASRVLEALRVNGWVGSDERRYDRVREVLAREWSVARGSAGPGPADDGSVPAPRPEEAP